MGDRNPCDCSHGRYTGWITLYKQKKSMGAVLRSNAAPVLEKNKSQNSGKTISFVCMKVVIMVKVRNIFGDRYSGTVGREGVYASWKGTQYRREYVVPTNPNTAKQQTIRGYFSDAVAAWHTMNTYQKKAYEYLASGLGMSGFNRFMQRYQNLRTGGEAAPTDPYFGLKIIAKGSTFIDEEAMGAVSSGTVTLTAGHVLARDEQTPGASTIGFITDGSVATGASLICDSITGKARVLVAAANKYWASYEYDGNVVTGEEIGTPSVGDFVQLEHFPIDAGTLHIYDEATFAGAAEDVAIEINMDTGAWVSCDGSNLAAGSTVDCTEVEYIANAKLTMYKVDSSTVTYREYSGSKGELFVSVVRETDAVPATDQNQDINVDATGYEVYNKYNRSPSAAGKPETLVLTAA